MTLGERLARATVQLAKDATRTLVACTIKSVEGETCTCTPLDESPDIEGVLITAGPNGFLIVPKVGSLVYVESGEEYTLKLFSEIDGFNAFGDIIFNGGENGGLVLLAKLVEKINALAQLINSHQHLYINTAGVPTPTTLDPTTNAPITPTTVTELENPKVKH